jgi:hypothetical protein
MFKRKMYWVALAAFCAALVASSIFLRDSFMFNTLLVLGSVVTIAFLRNSNGDT